MSSEAWIFNPKAQLSLSVMAPLKGASLQVTNLLLDQDAELAAAVWLAFTQPERIRELSADQQAQLQTLGLMVAADQIPGEIFWHCGLPTDLPFELIPYAGRLPEPPAQLMLNPTLAWQRPDGPPPEFRGRLRDAHKIQSEAPLFWLDDPGTRILQAYQPDAKQLRLMGLLHGRLPATGLDPELRRQLYWANVLVEPDYLEARYALWQETLAAARATMQNQGYAVLRKLINPLQQGALRRYLRRMETEGYFRVGDSQVKLRNSIYNEAMARYFHHQLNYVVNQITPEDVIPSYCYLSVYQPGAVLRKHRDRRQCAWNMSLILDMEPEQPQAEAWPIYLELPSGRQEVRLEMGDAVIYRGHDIDHWREALGEHQRVTACFYHFVDENFDEALG